MDKEKLTPKSKPAAENGSNFSNNGSETEGKKQAVILRHKTEYLRYRRAGLVLTQKAETYEVSDAQLVELRKDPWVVICQDKKDGTDK